MPRRDEASPYALKIGQRIQTLTSERGFTIERLGEASGIAKGHLSNIIRGLSLMTVVTIKRVASGLNMPAFMLFVSPDDGPREKLVDVIGRWSPEKCEALLASLSTPDQGPRTPPNSR